jgi:S-adenosylmethionine synthetase
VKNGLTDHDLEKLIAKNFDLRPGIIIRDLKLKRPIFAQICLYNHFMPSQEALWEVPKNF